jgi:hypothetical protein
MEATINMAATVTNIDSERRGPKPGYRQAPDTRVKAALLRHAGNITGAAQALHMSRQALHARVQRSPELQTAARDAREQIADIADSKIVQSIKRGDMATVRWFADRQMRDRGYGRHDEAEQKPPPDPERDARKEALMREFIQALEDQAEAKARRAHPQIVEATKSRPALPGKP